MTFATLIERFETLLAHEDLKGSLPYAVLPAEEVVWLYETVKPLLVSNARGYRVINGDLILLFYVSPAAGGAAGGADMYQDASEALARAAAERYARSEDEIWTFVDGDFGYVVVSRDNLRDLGRLAQ